jgi:integrase
MTRPLRLRCRSGTQSGRVATPRREDLAAPFALPERCVVALIQHRDRQDRDRAAAGGTAWQDSGLVFASAVGTPLDAANVRRAFRRVVRDAGLNRGEWTPRELRHSFVSLLSSSGVSLEDIANLCGHSGTTVTEKVYRHQLRPVLVRGAEAMDRIFDSAGGHDER